jgi:uncharacterized integral membrane protein (TIGR00697 family)
MDRNEKAFFVMGALFLTCILVTNVLSAKICGHPLAASLAITPGDFTYPLTYLCSDMICEVWGKKRANFLVAVGFGATLFILAFVQLAIALPPHEYWVSIDNPYGYTTTQEYQHAYVSVFGTQQMLVLASMVAYLMSQFIDVSLFQFLKNLTKDRHLWLRNNGATLTSQLVDTAVWCTIFFKWGLGLEWSAVIQMGLFSYMVKASMTLMGTPICYAGVWGIRRYLNKKDSKEALGILLSAES